MVENVRMRDLGGEGGRGAIGRIKSSNIPLPCLTPYPPSTHATLEGIRQANSNNEYQTQIESDQIKSNRLKSTTTTTTSYKKTALEYSK